jgi:hypothetical protein
MRSLVRHRVEVLGQRPQERNHDDAERRQADERGLQAGQRLGSSRRHRVHTTERP